MKIYFIHKKIGIKLLRNLINILFDKIKDT